MRTLPDQKPSVRTLFRIDVMMFDAKEGVCLRSAAALAGVLGSRLPLPVSALAAPTFWPAAQLNIDSSHRIPASTHPSPIQSLVASRLHHIELAAHPPKWCQSRRARPCSRSLIDLCPRFPSSASAVRTSQRQTPAWARCHQCWVCDDL